MGNLAAERYCYEAARIETNHKPFASLSRSIKGLTYPHQQISQAVPCQNHPPISNPARTNNVARRKRDGRCDSRFHLGFLPVGTN
jgi:hypothetical protein